MLGNNILKDHKVMSDQEPATKQFKIMAKKGGGAMWSLKRGKSRATDSERSR